jgi:hypothetical protein
MKNFARVPLIGILSASALAFGSEFPSDASPSHRRNIPSPDQSYVASLGQDKSGESNLLIGPSHGMAEFIRDFGSEDGEHGELIQQAEWTPDSRFFVIITEHAGGHGPLMHPIYFWDRRTNRFYSLDRALGGTTSGFKVQSPDIVSGRRLDAKNGDGYDNAVNFSVSLRKYLKKEFEQPNISLNGRRP